MKRYEPEDVDTLASPQDVVEPLMETDPEGDWYARSSVNALLEDIHRQLEGEESGYLVRNWIREAIGDAEEV